LTLFIAKSEARQTLVNPRIAASSPGTPLTCHIGQPRDDGDELQAAAHGAAGTAGPQQITLQAWSANLAMV